MYSIIEEVIKSGCYELTTFINKIDKLWIEDKLTESERDDLIALARSNAIPDNSYIENTQQIANLWEYYQELGARISALENNGSTEPPVMEEYPEYIQPTGSHDSYKIGDKITFNSNRYICKVDNCVWDPVTYPQGWELVEEN